MKLKTLILLTVITVLVAAQLALADSPSAWVVYINSYYNGYQEVKIEGNATVQLMYTFDNGRLVINSIRLTGSSVYIDFTWQGSRYYPYLGISQSNGNHGYLLHDSNIGSGRHVMTLRLAASVSSYPYLHFFKTCIAGTGGPLIATIDLRNVPSGSPSTTTTTATTTTATTATAPSTSTTTTVTTTATTTVTTTMWFEGIKDELQAVLSGISSSSNTSMIAVVAVVLAVTAVCIAAIAARRKR